MEMKKLFETVLAVLTDIRVPIALLGVFIFIFLISFICDSDKCNRAKRYTETIGTIKTKKVKSQVKNDNAETGTQN